MPQPVSRRFFMWALGLIGVDLALPGSPLTTASIDGAVQLQERLTALFGDTTSARVIGQAYLRETPAEADRERLAAVLHDVIESPACQRKLKQKCCEDFAAGNIVMVRGWVLARTEAQLCALAATA